MKRIFTVLIFSLLALRGFSISDKIRLGLQASPGIAWAAPLGNDIQRGAPRFGINYGFVFEYWFDKNYGISTGLNGAFDGCNLKGRDAFQDSAGVFKRRVNEKYGFHYVELPVYLKLKTNNIKSSQFCAWGQVGFTLNFTVGARATYSDSIPLSNPAAGNTFIEKENILPVTNPVGQSIPGFHSNYFDIRLGIGGGVEYRIDEKTSVFAGLFYHNGLINDIIDHDAKKEANLMRLFCLQVGVLF